MGYTQELAPLTGEKNFKPGPENRILVECEQVSVTKRRAWRASAMDDEQVPNYWGMPPSFLNGSSPQPGFFAMNGAKIYLGFHQFSSYFPSRRFVYEFCKLGNLTPVKVIIEIERPRWFRGWDSFAEFTRICLVFGDSYGQLLDPFSENTSQANNSLFLKCLKFLSCDNVSWKSTRIFETKSR